MLDRAAELVAERRDDLAPTIAAEAGKPIKTATVEAERCVDTLDLLRGRGAQADRRHGADGGLGRRAPASSA